MAKTFGSILLRRERRRGSRELIYFLDGLGGYLACGFDLAYAWPQAMRALALGGSALEMRGNETVGQALSRLSREYPDAELRLWFETLRELYLEGAGMSEAIRAFSGHVQAEHARELDRFCRNLPLALNLGLLIFFLPPVLALLLVPLVSAFLGTGGF